MRYGVLFEVEILHDYFLNLGSVVHEALADTSRAEARSRYAASFLEVSPDVSTRRTLAGHRLIFKPAANGFLVGVELDPAAPDTRPLVPPAADLRLVFELTVRDPRFFNFSAVAGPGEGRYRFANDSANEIGGGRFLTVPVPTFDPTRAYRAGEIRSAPSAPTVDLFRALRDTGPSATPEAEDWERIPPDTWDATVTYARGAVVLSANRVFRALVDGPGTDLGNAGDWQLLEVLANQYVTAADLDPAAERGAGFGVIEITAGSGGMALLDGGGALRSPRYTVRFLNRASRWRYVFPAIQPIGTGAEVVAEAGDGRVLITPAPRPLTRFGPGVRLQADDPGTAEVSEEVLLPAPETRRIRHQSSQWYSEIHISNLPL